jgi:hypothetical protein
MNTTVFGIQGFYAGRRAVGSDVWRSIFDSKREPGDLFFMGRTMLGILNDADCANALASWCSRGASMRLLFANPSADVLAEVAQDGPRRDRQSTFVKPARSVRLHITAAIRLLEEKVLSRALTRKEKVSIRCATFDLHCSLFAVDSDLIAMPYLGPGCEDDQPFLLIRGQQTDAYKSFRAGFETIWAHHSVDLGHTTLDPVELDMEWPPKDLKHPYYTAYSDNEGLVEIGGTKERAEARRES